MFFEGLASVEDGFVFDGSGNHMLFTAASRLNDSENGVVVRLCAAAGENDFLGAGADEGGNLLTGGLHGGAGALAGSVDGGSVGKFAGEIGKHGVEHSGLDGRGGVEIEIDAVHKASY